MALLIDREIRALLADGLLEPHHPDRVGAASLDFQIGTTAIELDIELEDGTKLERHVNLLDFSKENPYLIAFGSPILVATYEKLTLPDTIAATIALKSSRAREGYMHPYTFVDPGWSGLLTLEISNTRSDRLLPIYPGMAFGQLLLHRCSATPDAPYTGRYQSADAAQSSRG